MRQSEKQRSTDQKLLIKVCGMRDPDNIRALLELEPELFGMIFYPGSKRYVGNDPLILEDPSIVEGLSIVKEPLTGHGTDTLKTGVFVNAELNYISSTVKNFNLDAVQLHGDETTEYCTQLRSNLSAKSPAPSTRTVSESKNRSKIQMIKAFGIDPNFEWAILEGYTELIDYFLFDTRTPAFGGSGKKFDWTLLDQYKLDFPYFISGGIGEEDLPEVVELGSRDTRLVGVDLNSKYETQPGYKAIDKLKKTFKFVRDER